MFRIPTLLKVPEHVIRGILAREEIEKRQLEKAKSLGWIDGDPYSPKEIVALHEIHCSLVTDHFLTYAPGGAIWQAIQGHVADLSISPILRIADDVYRAESSISEPEISELLQHIGAHMAVAIRDNNAELFYQLHMILSYRRDGKSLSELTLKDLGIKSGRGRKPSPIDLSRLFPIALARVTGNRLEGYQFEGEGTKERISRAEIIKDVKQRGGTISESELSRWITKFKFGSYMAEQPIAQKRRKKPN